MDYQLALAILALLVAAYAAYLQREQLKLTAAASKKGAAKAVVRPWWSSASFIALLIVTALAWVPFGISTWQNWKEVRVGVGVLVWGAATPDLTLLHIVVQGSELRP